MENAYATYGKTDEIVILLVSSCLRRSPPSCPKYFRRKVGEFTDHSKYSSERLAMLRTFLSLGKYVLDRFADFERCAHPLSCVH